MKTNFKIFFPEPHEPETISYLVVRANSANEAKKYLRWLHCLYNNGKPLKLTAIPTNEDEDEMTEPFYKN